jgi:hypothetical protein
LEQGFFLAVGCQFSPFPCPLLLKCQYITSGRRTKSYEVSRKKLDISSLEVGHRSSKVKEQIWGNSLTGARKNRLI